MFSDPAIPLNKECGEPEYCHQFFYGDHLRGQFYQTPCGVNEICDPTFSDVTVGADLLNWAADFGSCPPPGSWALGSGWACNAGTVAVDGTTASGGVTKTSVGLSPDTTYKVTFDVTRTAGYFRIQLDDIFLYSNIFEVTGSYTTYITTNSVIAFDIFVIDGDGFTGSVENVKIEPVTYACWTPDPAWNLSDLMACKTDDTIGGTLTESVANYTTVNGYYQLSFTISNYVSGTLVAKVAGVTDQDTTVVSANGNYTLYFEPGASGVVSFEPSTDFVGCIENPDLRELKNDYEIEIRDADTQILYYTITPSYYHQYVTFDYNIAADSEAVDQVGLQYGCYRIHVYDFCNVQYADVVTNGGFSGSAGSTPPSPWEMIYGLPSPYDFSGGNMSCSTVGDTTQLVQDITGKCQTGNYELMVDVTSLAAAGSYFIFAIFDLSDNSLVMSTQFNTVANNQLYSFSATFVDNHQYEMRLAFRVVGAGTNTIDNLRLNRVAPFTAEFTSECFQYKEANQNTRMFVGYCDSPSLGFEFENTGFKLVQRLTCRSFAPTYEVDRKIYNYGSGSSGVYYSEVQKWFGVYLDAVPETVHDTMNIQMNCDHFLIGTYEDIGTTEYVAKPDDYTPEWERSGLHSLATVRFDVKPKEGGQFFNRDC